MSVKLCARGFGRLILMFECNFEIVKITFLFSKLLQDMLMLIQNHFDYMKVCLEV